MPNSNDSHSSTTRRHFFAGTAGLLLTGCVGQAQSEASVRLHAKPGKTTAKLAAGTHPLGIRSERDAILLIPKSADLEKPATLLVYLHGAGGPRPGETQRMNAVAEESGVILLSPQSLSVTWDAIRDGYGPDVRAIDQALEKTFAALNIDPQHLALSGFSDGASYSLGLGLSNGSLFKSVLAFSPGFIPPGSKPNGNPRLFVSHGTADNILPIDNCSRVMVPELKRNGYKVTYREFDGPHTVPPDVLKEAIQWIASA